MGHRTTGKCEYCMIHQFGRVEFGENIKLTVPTHDVLLLSCSHILSLHLECAFPLGLVQTAHCPQSSLRLHGSQRPQALRRDFLPFVWSGESTEEPPCLSKELGGMGVASPLLSEPKGEGWATGEGASWESNALIGLNGSAGRVVLVGEFCHTGREAGNMGRKLGKTLADMTLIAARLCP